jgi:hypothetical protein
MRILVLNTRKGQFLTAVFGLGLCNAKLSCTKFAKHAGNKIHQERIMEEAHTPFGRSIRPILRKSIVSIATTKPHFMARDCIITHSYAISSGETFFDQNAPKDNQDNNAHQLNSSNYSST